MTNSTTEPAGVVVLDKPEGPTSHDVVARMRRVLATRRVGHAGTLDPMATGVLVLAFGRGTRLLPFLQATDKQYVATIRLGVATTTDDRTGDALGAPAAVDLDAASVRGIMAGFTGPILQRPSAISAIKVDGARAYARVRAGEQIELAPRPVTVHRLDLQGRPRGTAAGLLDIDVVVECSSGTYIRALARDIGGALGVGGHLVALRRTRVGPFRIEDAAALPAPDGPVPPAIDLGRAAAAALPSIVLDDADARKAVHGQQLAAPADAPRQPVAMLDGGGRLVGIARPDAQLWRWLAVFAAA